MQLDTNVVQLRDAKASPEGGFGAVVRSARKRRGWTLAQLSQATDIPQSTLSKFETNTLSLPLDRIFRIGDALDLTITELFEQRTASEQVAGRRSIHRAGAGRRASSSIYAREWLFGDLLQKRMFPVMQTLLARSLDEFGPMLRHQGEEFAFVLKGRVQFVSDIYEGTILEEGDGVYIDSQMAHAFLNAGEGEAIILNVCTSAVEPPAIVR